MRLFIAGKGAFGAAVLGLAREAGHDIAGISAPPFNSAGNGPDQLRFAGERCGAPWTVAGTLNADTLPPDVDLIVAAHSHDFIGRKTRMAARLGGIGYHPSLLPRHRGRDAVRWTIHMKDAVAGGSVYWLSERVDGGDIAAQDFVFVDPDDTPETLWRRKLFPMGVRLFSAVLADLGRGVVRRQKQEEVYATWEPSWERAPLARPDLMLLGHLPEGFTVSDQAARAVG